MKISKQNKQIIFIALLTATLGLCYYALERFFYSDAGCGCSSACSNYFPDLTSRLFGYCMMAGAVILFWISILKIKAISRWWSVVAVVVFGIAFYGNGYRIYNKGACGYSIYKSTFFIKDTKVGDFAKSDAETIHLDSLKAGKYKGKLLGYTFNGNELTIFKIGEKPAVVKTRFLFWGINSNELLNDISYGLNTYRNFEAEKIPGHYEFIGGEGMTEKDFLDEFAITQNGLTANKLSNKRIIQAADGTTRFLFEL